MGKLYNTLNNIEMARANAVRNAKAAGLPATDEMSLTGLSELYRLQNNNENIQVETIEWEPWEEPEDWIDIKSILENEPNLFYNDKEYTPIFITLLTDDGDVSNDILNNSPSSYDIVLKTSDGQILQNTTFALSEPIVWDTEKDIPCSLGYNMRYIIYYWNTESLNSLIDRGSTLPTNYVFYNKPIIKIVYGNFYFDTIGTFYTQSNSTANPYITVLDCLPNTMFRQIPIKSYNSSISNITGFKNITLRINPDTIASHSNNYLIGSESMVEKLTIYGLKHTTNSAYSFYSAFYLREINLPDLEICGNLLYNCDNLETVSLPKLKTATALLFFSMNNLKNIELPVIEQSGAICESCNAITSIVLPTLKKISSTYGSIVNSCSSLRELILPSLEEIETTSMSYTYSYSLISGCPNLRYVQLPSLKNIDIKSMVAYSSTDFTLDLPIVETISAAYLTSSGSNVNLKINAPFLKSITIQDITPSSYYNSNVYLSHNNPIDITIATNYQSPSSWTSGFPILRDDKINHIIFGRELNLAALQLYLRKTKFKKVTCKIKTGPTVSNVNKPIYLNNGNVLCRDGVELDLLDGSDMSTHTLLNHNNLVKFLTNLIALPEGETRTLTLGETLLAKLTEEEKAIATNKGWVLA